MGALAEACKRAPFSNGTEGEAWMSVWCDLCIHNHGFENHDSCGEGCDLLLSAFFPDDFPWPEAWLPEPADVHCLPSAMICSMFEPCNKGGECDGSDPHAEIRATTIAETTEYWRQNP